jgi:hypothetical protein
MRSFTSKIIFGNYGTGVLGLTNYSIHNSIFLVGLTPEYRPAFLEGSGEEACGAGARSLLGRTEVRG